MQPTPRLALTNARIAAVLVGDRRPARDQGRVLVQGRRLSSGRRLGRPFRRGGGARPTARATRPSCAAWAGASASASRSSSPPGTSPITRPCARRCRRPCWSCWPSPAWDRARPARSGARWASPRCRSWRRRPGTGSCARCAGSAPSRRRASSRASASSSGGRRVACAWARPTPCAERVVALIEALPGRRLGDRRRVGAPLS